MPRPRRQLEPQEPSEDLALEEVEDAEVNEVNEVNVPEALDTESAASTAQSFLLRQTAASIEWVKPAIVITPDPGDCKSEDGRQRSAGTSKAGSKEAPAPRASRREETMRDLEWRDSQFGNKATEVAKAMRLDVKSLQGSRLLFHRWISWSGFDTLIGLVIIANAATIGLEAHFNAALPLGCDALCVCPEDAGHCEPVPLWLTLVDYAFFLVYVAEFCLRFYAYGRICLRSNWVKFDLFLIISSTCDLLLKLLNVQNDLLNQVMLVRMLRLLRLARAVRLMVQFQTLWQLVQGLLHSVTTLLWTFLLVMILIYIFAIIGIEFIAVDAELPEDHPYNVAARENFSSFGDAVITLLQMFSMDSIGSIYRPLVKHRFLLFFYFMTVLLILAIALMNLVTAVMVNSSLDQASEDKDAKKAWEEAKKKKQMEELKLMFHELDEDGSGDLSLDEIRTAPEHLRLELKELAGNADIEELFVMLDYDGGGAVDSDEFCEGVFKAASCDKESMELSRLTKQCSLVLGNSRSLLTAVSGQEAPRQVEDGSLETRIGKLEQEVQSMRSNMRRVLMLVDEKPS
ncbi:unnamed protein product [Effrenium voratum]|uniref:EF-hand domain-containing protein n=1 Tax=Effrenium voratum TaxID=2562239 RepID=A0AA36MSJ3_9DINO|nr:unnamed protein product [Effrenium voratum]